MNKIRIGMSFIALVIVLFFLAGCFSSSSSDEYIKQGSYLNDPNGDWYKLYYTDVTKKDALSIMKKLDARAPEFDPDEKSIIVFLTPEEALSYSDQGFEMEELDSYNPFNSRSDMGNVRGIPGYSCYRKVAETFSDAKKLSTEHPDLVTWKSEGKSYLKSINQGGENVWVLVVTNKSIKIPKPALYITGSIHAREYVTAETALRFGEYLVNNYGVDPDVTWLVDYQEIHIMPVLNPDGRKMADGTKDTALWRKNKHLQNNNYCSSSGHYGVDLNRNFSYKWNTSGTSSNVCNEVYSGKSALSEPEAKAVIDYTQALFDDYNTSPTTQASLDAQGIHIDLHSYGEMILWPWGYGNALAPNHSQLRTLARKMAFFSGYLPQKSSGLYPAAGDTCDDIYSKRGIPSFCFELGTAFFQGCSKFENTIFPKNLKTLIYAAKASRAPYRLPLGPEVLNVKLNNNVLTAVVDDKRYEQSNGTESSQIITAAEYYIDKPYWDNGVPISMTAADGSFNSESENVKATINTANLSSGNHIVFVRGKDKNGNWGPYSSVFLKVDNPLQYTLTVGNGSGDGSYAPGESITIEADESLEDNEFGRWKVISGNPKIADENSSTTTLTMPSGHVEIIATYKEADIGCGSLFNLYK